MAFVLSSTRDCQELGKQVDLLGTRGPVKQKSLLTSPKENHRLEGTSRGYQVQRCFLSRRHGSAAVEQEEKQMKGKGSSDSSQIV